MEFIDKIFMYGNFKKNQMINNKFDYIEYIGKAETIKKFDMVNLGGYPGVAYNSDKGYKISGELYSVSRNQLKELDQLKGEGIYFDRVLDQIFIVNNSPERNGALFDCWIYILKYMPDHYDDSNIFLTTKNLLTYERI